MDLQLALLCGLTFVIHLIGALAYAVADRRRRAERGGSRFPLRCSMC